MKKENIPGISGVDTRALTKLLREHGTMLAKLVCDGVDPNSVPMEDPNKINLVAEVSCKAPQTYNPSGNIKVTVVDCGMKLNQLRCLVSRGAAVTVVPWDHDFKKGDWDGLFISNGPGDPMMASTTIANLRDLLSGMASQKYPVKPIFGICLGHQVQS
jgi:carbamoyl-phosphate synthase small subunit